mgnify:CR=1 FL=1
METGIEKGGKYIHYKTKGVYVATLQAPEESGLDMCECVVYKKEDDCKLWVRPVTMFLEKVTDNLGQSVSRFERV